MHRCKCEGRRCRSSRIDGPWCLFPHVPLAAAQATEPPGILTLTYRSYTYKLFDVYAKMVRPWQVRDSVRSYGTAWRPVRTKTVPSARGNHTTPLAHACVLLSGTMPTPYPQGMSWCFYFSHVESNDPMHMSSAADLLRNTPHVVPAQGPGGASMCMGRRGRTA